MLGSMASVMFQSTRPRGARRLAAEQVPHRADVSIHASTRGATHKVLGVFKTAQVSIHAPTRGATKRDCEDN